jgi:hypothetical protein
MLCGGYKIDYVNEEAEELVSTSIRSKIEILIWVQERGKKQDGR